MNPQKESKKIELECQHRLIIVVFIPELQGYYKSMFNVFKLCLSSAVSTINGNCAITIVNNGSCEDIKNYLDEKLQANVIDTVIHHAKNIGKIDALIGAARASREPLITISDVDILFEKGWQEATETIFSTIKNVASVSPIPCKLFQDYETSSTLLKILMKKVKFTYEVIPSNFQSHNRYLKSFNWKLETNKNSSWPVIESNGVKCIVGSGHQILTMRRELFFSNVPLEPSLTLVGNKSEYQYCDLPINLSGGMRVSTYHNKAFHMGNEVERWMFDIQKKNEEYQDADPEQYVSFSLPSFNPKRPNPYWFSLKKRITHKLFNIIYKKK
ncbi:glycosyltransferase [Winogradskyella aurantia]|uniref:Glycosyltransferase 2-like domain-containing protein n=1 Tax=Winogradskyella aurantia TaxID=1915063 RepID=A0A265UQG7_9FLAO|nr:glycosyltransferase [Winogradskyella aurantia]OZV67581.1 hypothetical protein CA834_11565 [Winogradskyella aurantia]